MCPLENWLDDDLLQAIAEEINLSETAFFVSSVKGFNLRWFTPIKKVVLCGHVRLAKAHIIFESLGFTELVITFETRSGDLFVKKRGSLLQMDFPANKLTACEISEGLVQGFGVRPIEVLAGNDYMVVFDSEAQLVLRGVIVIAPGTDVDFVSRFFATKIGIPEDPVTGAAHCKLAPYWAGKLGKNTLSARQVSKRGGNLACEVKNDRVVLSRSAVTFMEAEIAYYT